MSQANRAVARFFGAVLMAVGGLISILSGGCTAMVLGTSLIAALTSGYMSQAFQGAILALMFGVPPLAIGLGLFLGGRGLWQGPKPVKRNG